MKDISIKSNNQNLLFPASKENSCKNDRIQETNGWLEGISEQLASLFMKPGRSTMEQIRVKGTWILLTYLIKTVSSSTINIFENKTLRVVDENTKTKKKVKTRFTPKIDQIKV